MKQDNQSDHTSNWSLPECIISSSAPFWKPNYTSHSAWTEHVPFAFWLTEYTKPKCIVELGTHYGVSYFAFCQAVARLNINCTCFSVDTWRGDEHAGFYNESVFQQVNKWNHDNYQQFSTLIRKKFDDAIRDFPDGKIDILHIDGLHTYEAVSHDYKSWFQKLSPNALILFHDTAERNGDFGVFKFFEELSQKHPSFSFIHCHGLGVIQLKADKDSNQSTIFSLTDLETVSVRAFFHTLGKAQRLEFENENKKKTLTNQDSKIQRLNEHLSNLEVVKRKNDELTLSISKAYETINQERAKNSRLAVEINIANRLKTQLEKRKAKLLKEVEQLSSNGQFILTILKSLAKNISRLEKEKNKRIRALENQLNNTIIEESNISQKTTTPYKRPLEKTLNRKKEISLLLKSGLFDTTFYASSNALKCSSESLVLHYLKRDDQEEAKVHPLFSSASLVALTPSRVTGLSLLTNFLINGDRLASPTPIFDAQFYLKNNSDVENYEYHPISHFLAYGWKEMRDPNILFNTAYYWTQTSKEKPANENPLLHFLHKGWHKNYNPHPLFLTEYYLIKNQDVKKSGANPLAHFLTHGGLEARNPHPLFLSAWYLENYKDVAKNKSNPLTHFLQYGSREGRNPNPLFDCKFFQKKCKERSIKCEQNPLALYSSHQEAFKIPCHPLFDSSFYLNNNEDVRTANQNPLVHFLEYGEKEGRRPCPNFDPKWYSKRMSVSYGEIKKPSFHFLKNVTSSKLQKESDNLISAVEPKSIRMLIESKLSVDCEVLSKSLLDEAKNYLDLLNPSVSIIMPTWNRAKSVIPAIKSALNQSWSNFELIIADDGSTDNTLNVISSTFKNEIRLGKIILIPLHHQGVSAARNAALEYATGSFIAYLDSDNTWRSHHLLLTLGSMLLTNSSIAYTDVICHVKDQDRKQLLSESYDRAKLLQSNFIDLNALVHKRTLLNKVGTFDEKLRRYVDWDLIIRLSKENTPLRIPVITVDYYLNKNELSNISYLESSEINADRVYLKNLAECIDTRQLNFSKISKILSSPFIDSFVAPIKSSSNTICLNLILDPIDNPSPSLQDYLLHLDIEIKSYRLIEQEQCIRIDSQGEPIGETLDIAELSGLFWKPNLSETLPHVEQLRALIIAMISENLDFAILSYDLHREGKIAIESISNQIIFDSILPILTEDSEKLRASEIGRVLNIPPEQKANSSRSLTLPQLGGSHLQWCSKTGQVSSSTTNRIPSSDVEHKLDRALTWHGSKKIVFVFAMKVAVGGVERNTIEVIRALKGDYHFFYITLEKVSAQQGSLAGQAFEVSDRFLDLAEITQHSNYLSVIKSLKNIYAPDLLWICNGSMWLCDNAINIRKIFSDTPIIDQQVYDYQEGWIKRYNEPGVQSFDHFIAINKKIESVFLNKFKIPEESISQIYPCFDGDRMMTFSNTNPDPKQIGNLLNLPQDKQLYVFMGRLVEQKQPFRFLELVKSRMEHKSEHFVMVGNGPLSDEVDAWIAQHQLDNLTRINYLEKVEQLWFITDGMVITSIFEGLPIAMLEALTMSVPIFSNDVGDVGLVLKKYNAGRVIPVESDSKATLTAFHDFTLEKHNYKNSLNSHNQEIVEYFSAQKIGADYRSAFEYSISKKSL